MQVDIQLDKDCGQTRVIIVTDRISEEVTALAERLQESAPSVLTGFRDGALHILEQNDISRVYAEGGRVCAVTAAGEYQLKQRLYELEERLDKRSFARISHSEIINLKRVRNFDLSIAGTICVRMLDGAVTYVSRRYVSKIKEALGI